MLLLLLLSCFSCVRLCVTPEMATHQAPPSLGFSRQEHWSGLPFPSPVHESEKWKWSHSVVSHSSRPHGLQPTRLLCPWDFPARVLEWGAIAFSEIFTLRLIKREGVVHVKTEIRHILVAQGHLPKRGIVEERSLQFHLDHLSLFLRVPWPSTVNYMP